MLRVVPLALAGFLSLSLLFAVVGQEKKPDDFSSVLPRIKPLSPQESAKRFQLRPGFTIELVASEPMLRSPVAMDFDENGRIYVAEYPEYNQYANKKFKGHGGIRLLEDTDGDGRMDRSILFADNLDSPVAVACYDGGVFVGVVPDILYLKDTDGDGKADVRRRVFTGFARDRAGEAMLNSFRWCLDNRFHVSTSLAGGLVRRVGDKKSDAVNVRGRMFLFDPRTLTFEVSSGGGQHGMSMDDWGRTFVCANSKPIQMLMYDGRYLARNPYLEAPSAVVSIAPRGKYTKLFRISPDEPWRVLRTRLRSQKKIRGSDEGGKPSGFFTGATGITVYRGNAWPARYRGNVFVGEVANNLLYRARLEPQGVGFVARRADRDVEFLASRDRWFRPVQLANAPDGTLYVIDMYRELIEGAAFLAPQILKHMDVASGMDRGRIWRIVPTGFKRPRPPALGKRTTAQLVALLEHPNGWHRDTVSRLLYQRQDRTAVAPLRQLAQTAKEPLGRIHALYALAGLEALEVEQVLHALGDREARVREHALRLAERFPSSPQIQKRLPAMTDDPDARVRYQLAFSLGALPGPGVPRALVRLAERDGADSWMRLAILSSSHQRAGLMVQQLVANQKLRKTRHGQALLITLAKQIGAANRPADVAAVVKAVGSLPTEEKLLAQALVRNLVSKQSASARKTLSGAAGGKAGSILVDLLREARKKAEDSKTAPGQRAAAVRTLGLASFANVRTLFAKLLTPDQPQVVQQAVLETVSRFEDPEVPGLILDSWSGLSPRLRATAAETLFARTSWIQAFLKAVEQGKVKRGDVDPARIQLLRASTDGGIRARAAKLFGKRMARRAEVVARYRQALRLKGDAKRGKMVFQKNCSTCHRLEGVGQEVGADLKAIRDRGAEAVLLNILDPNREVKPSFLSYTLETRKGKILTGMITAETANSITLRRPDGSSVTVLRINIETLNSSGLSYMPEGLEKQVNLQSMADLLAYLDSIR